MKSNKMKIRRTFSSKFPESKGNNQDLKDGIHYYENDGIADLCIIKGSDIFYRNKNSIEIKKFLSNNLEKMIMDNCTLIFYENYIIKNNHIISFLKDNNLEELLEMSYYADNQKFYGSVLN